MATLRGGALRAGVVALLLLGGLAAAAEPAPDLAALRARLDELSREAEETARRATESANAAEARLAERRAKRHELAEAVLALELERARLDARARDLDKELATARTDAKEAAHSTGAIPPEGAACVEQIGLVLDGMPGTSALSGRASAVREDLAAESGAEAAVSLVPALLADTLETAANVTVRRTDVRLASGAVEMADLLTAGNAAFAYRAGDRFGVALASPADATGYRWTESLDPRTRKAVAAAFADASGDAEVCRVPMDTSGMLRVDDELHGWTFARIWDSGGPMMWPLAAVALLSLLLVCERVVYLARQGGRSEKVLDKVLEACGKDDHDAARAACAGGHGVVVRGLSACLKQAKGGAKAMENGFQEQLLHELPRLDRSMSQIGTLAAVAPLLGLLGTVTGIIQTFGVIRVFGNANPGLMAGGIAEALLTTATGLVIAIPVLLAHNLLQARVEALTGYAEQGAATLINRLAPGEET